MYIADAIPNHCVDLMDYTQISFKARSLKYKLIARLSFLNLESLIGKELFAIAVSRTKYGVRVLHLLVWDTTPKNQKVNIPGKPKVKDHIQLLLFSKHKSLIFLVNRIENKTYLNYQNQFSSIHMIVTFIKFKRNGN